MKILYYDCFSGISGDMNLGALIDAGVDKTYLENELKKLNLHGYSLNVKKDNRSGIAGTKADVVIEHHHNHHDGHHHEHRNLASIMEIINQSSLNENVKKTSCGIFKIVAEAEAKVHGKDITEVHFHEVGAIDSIVDIVGAAICLDYIKPDKIISSVVEVGSGFVKCAHGILPVPAPATAEILKEIPIVSKGIPFEAATPTGAAILAYECSEFTNNKRFKIINTGYGIGNNTEGDIPNVLRVFIAETDFSIVENDCVHDDVMVIETSIDDMNPERYEYIMERLFDNGALDVTLTPLIMKKGRPGINISVLASECQEENIRDILFNSSSTLGYRKYVVERDMLKRESKLVNTVYGAVAVKTSFYKGKKVKAKPEYEDCKKLAIENGIDINKIYDAAYKLILED